MKAPLALLICMPFIIWLWKRDARLRPKLSSELWIPMLWLMTLGSRTLSFWLGVGGGSDEEGNVFDRSVYLVQIFLSIYILSKRGFDFQSLWRRNKALVFFYGFLLLTALWSPSAFITFRRWFKDLGGIFVTLVILTEREPLEAVKAVFARCAYVLYPLSVIFIKYFPALGRVYTVGGDASYTGVTGQKNDLGAICLVFMLLMFSELIQPNRRKRGASFTQSHHFTLGLTFLIGIYLLIMCDSKTSLICFVLGCSILLGHKLPVFRGQPRRQLVSVFVFAAGFFLLNSAFSISDDLLRMIGRDPTLTHRTEIWEAVHENPVDPWIGCGYLNYWDMHKFIRVGQWDNVHINSAHNGYLEIYLDGGILGVIVLIITLIFLGIRASRLFLGGTEYGRLVFAFYIAMILFNLSESMYGRRSPLWFAFLLFSLNFRPVKWAPAQRRVVRRAVPVPA